MSDAPGVAISIVIASHNRREMLRRCLGTLSAQTQDPSTFEVIVADDGSDDGTAEMAEAFGATFRLRVLRLEKGGKSAALNAAIEVAAGSACVFLDDDVVASPELVAGHHEAHREDLVTLGIGKLVQPPPADGNWFGVAHAVAWNERYDALEHRQPDWPDTYGGNFSAPTEALRQVGGFATDLAAIEDVELGHRLCAAGCRPRYLPGADGVHDDEKPRAKILADMRRFGEFCARYAEREPRTRPKLLGWFLETTPREVMLRRLFLALRLPPRALAPLGAAIPGAGRKGVWVGFVSRYCFWLGARTGMTRERWRQSTRGVPVLMYHAFSEGEEDDRYVISRRSFERQLRLLGALRYRAIPFEELAETLRAGEAPPPRSVAITIDDGYRDNLEIALPLLQRHRLAAILFLVSRRLGGENDWTKRGDVAKRPLLSAEEAKQMRAGGVAIGAHTRTHCSLPAVAGGEVDGEIGGSREDLEELFGEPVPTFAYPYGRFDERAVAACERAGLAACTVESRPARLGDDPLLIPRIEIRGEDSLRRFLRKLWFAGV
jgi:glycosyltransferase involved in cell wall biosynthesis